MNLEDITMSLSGLSAAYRSGVTPRQVVAEFRRRLAVWDDPALFLSVADAAALEPLLANLEQVNPAQLPLYGVLFAVKDNIDWDRLPTTAGCPAFSYQPSRSATVVARLVAAGALPVGKTNLDQFATGLVGTRSLSGVPRNALNPKWIPGGSSSGSASAVAAGLVAFSLGTDTAGSGRVPAAFQELVGYKPTRGLVSTRGVVPACRTLDCVTVFARTVSEAQTVGTVMAGFDPEDPYSRKVALTRTTLGTVPRIGVPRPDQRDFFGDDGYAQAYHQALEGWKARGAQLIEVDAGPLLEAGKLLYEGPWVAERRWALESVWSTPEVLHPITRKVVSTAEGRTAVEAFAAAYRLEELRRTTSSLWDCVDFLALPTTVTLPTLDQEAAEPVALNSRLGTWTNAFNLLDWAGLAVPTPRCSDGRPFGLTLAAPAGSDRLLFEAGRRWESGSNSQPPQTLGPTVLAVAGAHLRGLPLNGQLVERRARFLGEARSAATYALYAFQEGALEKPGMVRVETGGISVPLELWDLPEEGWASFLALIPAPLGLGKVQLSDGRWVTGFLMEAVQVTSATDIATYGGWRAYLAATKKP
jgi:allophanate hydrolase